MVSARDDSWICRLIPREGRFTAIRRLAEIDRRAACRTMVHYRPQMLQFIGVDSRSGWLIDPSLFIGF